MLFKLKNYFLSKKLFSKISFKHAVKIPAAQPETSLSTCDLFKRSNKLKDLMLILNEIEILSLSIKCNSGL